MTPRILIVDDEPLLRSTLERALRSMGYEAISAGDTHVAYERLREGDVDAVLLDLHLPMVRGDAFFLTVVHQWPHLRGRVVLMTGDTFADRSHWPDVLRGCITLYKPFPLDLLRSTVAEVLGDQGTATRAENGR